MAFEITSPADEQLLATYTRARNQVRDTVSFGIYPQVLAALQAYAELDSLVAGLAQGAAKEQALAAYHAGLMVSIADETAALRMSAEALIASIETIEALQPGTFGIQLPPGPEN
jgi:hypothetical protein